MAIGDDASAAGMAVVPGTASVRDAYNQINLTRDFIAQRTSTVTPLTKGGTGATTAAAARTALDVPSNATLTSGLAGKQAAGSYAGRTYAGAISFNWSSGRLIATVDVTQMNIVTDTQLSAYATNSSLSNVVRQGTSFDASGGYIASLGSRNASVTTSYAAMYADGATGLFGVPSSSRAKKKDLREWTEEEAARFLELQALWGHYLEDGDTDPLRPFFILEEFIEAGFPEFVVYGQPQATDENGNPVVDVVGNPVYDSEAEPIGIGLHYELVSVALLAIAKMHAARISAQDARMDRLEARLDAAGI